MKLYTLPKSAWIASHVLIMLGLIFATIWLWSVRPGGAVAFAAIGAMWCFAGGLCVVFASAFAKLAGKK